MYRDPRCVYVAYQSMGEAAVVATFLQQHGIPAEVMNEATLGGLEGLTALAPGISSRGVEVWVMDPDRAREAVGLLAEAEAARLTKADEVGEEIHVVCEECGAEATFPASMRGSCQDCPRCHAFVDVGDIDDLEKQSEEVDDDRPPSEGIQQPPGFRRERE